MEKLILKNGIKLIYEHRAGKLSSFCIGFEAGALMEEGYKLGTAHAVEHMLFKGTKHRTEQEINKLCDNFFGFNNAMTNYPYCIYYGTSLSEDFNKGLELYSDIIINPSFPKEGFKEEISIIGEELKEWKDDITQDCEDKLLFNAFNNRRIKELIIGTEESIKALTIEELEEFYNEFYAPQNCIISVVSSLSFGDIVSTVENSFGHWKKSYIKKKLKLYEDNNVGTFINVRDGINGAKLQYIFPIHELTDKDLKALTLFNLSFGEGVSSVLFDEIRTKNGLVYDIGSSIKREKGIKLFSINLGTSIQNIDTALMLIDTVIEKTKKKDNFFTTERIKNNSRMIKLKSELRLEKSIVLCKELTTYELMYGSSDLFFKENEELDAITNDEILKVINKVLLNPSIEIIRPKM
jgi:predicted Zn-dependent peptidase